ncbi:glycosyltransferase family 4 protein [Candidatus Chloroploca asiatica]|uniref:Glycosyl transferase family 1 n=1 Tax=Candidatus Chloroploca asiatica TaxID=1506545 RepID=A0A2H3KUS7_9CHLR|nr:glycosyltransferase family 1 protein [Candidatus Chloroploca asiatica]PDV99082.1 hypothetical protein A9Q02_13440 [Candidatus Chloroploca asiatica]
MKQPTSHSQWHGTIALIAKPGGPQTGVGRYVQMLQHGLEAEGLRVSRVAPIAPPLPSMVYFALRRLGADVRTFLMNYPVWADYPSADVYHLTSQNLATLLLFRRPPGRVIVTVHDIIPYMLRNNPQLSTYRTFADRLFDWLAMRGLHRADHLVADSHYTKQTLIEHLGLAPERISVVHLGIDHERFQPRVVTEELRIHYGLPSGQRYLIYVGSEDPRKNLGTLLQALSIVRRQHPEVELIKVGRAHFMAERQRLVTLAEELGISTAIHWLDEVPEEDLPALYSLADLCVMPSLYEGFGFPVLEAMACGTPVVAANAASLPELVGDAGVLIDPTDVKGLADALGSVLDGALLREWVCLAGPKRAAMYTWERTVAETTALYQKELYERPATHVQAV